MRSSDNRQGAISREISQPWITKIILKITHLKFHYNLPGANELTYQNSCHWLCDYSSTFLMKSIKLKWLLYLTRPQQINTLRLRQNWRLYADDIFKWILLNENVWFPIKVSLKFVPKGLINNIPSLVQIMAWRRPGDKPLSEPMMVILSTHICVTRPQWVKEQHSFVWGLRLVL